VQRHRSPGLSRQFLAQVPPPVDASVIDSQTCGYGAEGFLDVVHGYAQPEAVRVVIQLLLLLGIKVILEGCPNVTARIVGDEGINAFSDAVKWTRNYYTHYNPKLEKKAATGAALLLLTIQLQAIIEMSLLRELGFTRRAIDQIMGRVGRYREISHLKAIVAEEAQIAAPT